MENKILVYEEDNELEYHNWKEKYNMLKSSEKRWFWTSFAQWKRPITGGK